MHRYKPQDSYVEQDKRYPRNDDIEKTVKTKDIETDVKVGLPKIIWMVLFELNVYIIYNIIKTDH